ncbi:aldehyde dehydrogenase family protein [Stutzerimonas xanthomarina]|uniref:aldehyde dehydrogenase family protein n=1 Tax=Stutzerimonas xanthomarina TaxID=271420 RepID=UPI003AA97260
MQPTLLRARQDARIQEEIFGPVISVTTFKDEPEALAIANDTSTAWVRVYGLATSARLPMGRAIKAGRVWTNCYHLYPAHAAFGSYKKSGVGRETHR